MLPTALFSVDRLRQFGAEWPRIRPHYVTAAAIGERDGVRARPERYLGEGLGLPAQPTRLT